jgi:PhnB protein
MQPEGYSTVSPYLVVDNAQSIVAFLKRVFGGVEKDRYDNPDGSIKHVEVTIGDSLIMMGDSGKGNPAFPSWLHVYVDDVDEIYQLALSQGAKSVQEPVQREGDLDKRGGVMDSSGNTWWIATRIE